MGTLDAELRLSATRLPFCSFLFCWFWVFHNTIYYILFWECCLAPLNYSRAECLLHPFTILTLTLTINRGCDESTTSALAQFLWWSPHKVIPTKFGFAYWCGLDVATSFGTVFLALMHVAIALVDFFFEPLVSNSFLDKYRQNAPCPDLIVPFPMERRGQSAKTHLLSLLCGN